MTAPASAPARAAPSAAPAVELQDVRFAYSRGPDVLDIPLLEIARGERVFVFGPSGSGKTTLLGVLAGVLRATHGAVRVLGRDLTSMSGAERDAFRAEHVGYIFQMFNLIPYLSVIENVTLPTRLSGARRSRIVGRSVEEAAHEITASLGIEELLAKRVTELSVGQQQRVAAARALLGAPELVIADEPTSALDSDRRERFLELLFRCCADAGATLVFVSHDRQLLPMFDRSVSLVEMNRTAGIGD